jgi:hypothetical protein
MKEQRVFEIPMRRLAGPGLIIGPLQDIQEGSSDEQ